MDQHLSTSLQVALYAASIAVIVLAAVTVYVLVRFKRQLDRVVTMVERVEAELVPLARDTRLAVDKVRDVSEHAQRIVETVRRVTGLASGALLAPMLVSNRAGNLARVGATTFLRTLWTGRRPASHHVKT